MFDVKTSATFVQSIAPCEPGEHATGGGFTFEVAPTTPITSLVSAPFFVEEGETPTTWGASMSTSIAGFKSITA